MNLIETRLPGVWIIEPRVFRDPRGQFLETWQRDRYAQAGIPEEFVQDNVSISKRNVLRGLHYQHPAAQGKLVTVLHGEVFDVSVDIRPDSPTFGHWIGVVLSSDNGRQVFIPPGFAHGFVVTAEQAVFSYKCTDFYRPHDEGIIRWDDADLAIDWPVAEPILAPKDRDAPRLRDVPVERLPHLLVGSIKG